MPTGSLACAGTAAQAARTGSKASNLCIFIETPFLLRIGIGDCGFQRKGTTSNPEAEIHDRDHSHPQSKSTDRLSIRNRQSFPFLGYSRPHSIKTSCSSRPLTGSSLVPDFFAPLCLGGECGVWVLLGDCAILCVFASSRLCGEKERSHTLAATPIRLGGREGEAIGMR